SLLRDGFAPRLGLFYAGVFLALGVQLPFLPVWLAAKGLDSAAIGIVLAAPMAVRIFAVPLVARAADRRFAIRLALIACTCGSAAACAAMGLVGGFLPILGTMLVMSVAYTPLMPLTDAYA